MSLKKNLLKNGLATSVQKLIRVFEQLALVPFFISAWGAAYYGEWLTLTIIPSVLAFSDLGFGTAAANSFVLKYVAGEKKVAADIAKTGLIIISLVIFAGIVIGGLILFLASTFGWLEHAIIPANEAIWAVSFMMLTRLLGFYTQLFEAYFRAARKAAEGINLSNIQNVCNIVVGFCVLFMGFGVVVFALSQFIIAICFRFYYAWRANKVLGLSNEYSGAFVKKYATDMFSKGLGYLMSPMWQVILFQGTTFIVRITLGASAVAVFNTVRTISRSVTQLYSIVNASIFSEIQYEIGAGNMDKARVIFVRSIQVSFVLSVAGFIFLTLFGLQLYNIWTNKTLTPPITMWYIFLGGILVNAIWWTSSVVFRAMNKPYKLTFVGLIAATLSVIISYVCCLKWGLTGAAIGSFAFELLMAIYVLPVSCRLMAVRTRRILVR